MPNWEKTALWIGIMFAYHADHDAGTFYWWTQKLVILMVFVLLMRSWFQPFFEDRSRESQRLERAVRR